MEQSFPVIEQPLPASQWSAVTKGIGNGILDEGGFPYRLIFESDANATNQGILKCPTVAGKQYGQAILEGFYHKYDADLPLDFPAVTAATTYYVVLEYSPVRATGGDLPVVAKVVTALDDTQGKNYLTLYTVQRGSNQLLTDATVQMHRPRVAPVQVYASEGDMPPAFRALWGTLAIVHGGRTSQRAKFFVAMTGDSDESINGWYWKLVYDQEGPDWEDLSLPGNRVWAGHGQRPQILRDGKRREIRGRVALPTGNSFGTITPGTDPYLLVNALPASDRPSATVGGFGQVSSFINPGLARFELTSGGDLHAAPSKTTAWIGMDGFSWYVD